MRCLSTPDNAQATIQTAFEQGINHFETAQGYGQSEVYLGQALRNLDLRSQVFITTKITPQASAEAMAQAIDQSLKRLNVNTIDCLAIHGINTAEHLAWVLAPKGCMMAVQAAIKAHKVNHVGFSSHGALPILMAAIESQQFEFVNLHYNFFFQRNQAAIQAAKQQDLGVFIISPADKGGMLYTPPPKLSQLCQPLEALQIAYRFLLSQSAITTLSVGPANPDELDWPLQYQDDIHPLTPTEKATLQRLEQEAIAQLGTDYCAQCYACLPCPEEIQIPEVLRLRNLALAYGMEDFGKYRYQMFERAGHWFPGKRGSRCTECGDCLPRCPSELAIADLVQDTHQRLYTATRPRLWDDRP